MICRGGGYMWGLLAGEARQQLPHIPFSTAIPNDPYFILVKTVLLRPYLIDAVKTQGAEHYPHHSVTEIRLQELIWTSAGDYGDVILATHLHCIL